MDFSHWLPIDIYIDSIGHVTKSVLATSAYSRVEAVCTQGNGMHSISGRKVLVHRRQLRKWVKSNSVTLINGLRLKFMGVIKSLRLKDLMTLYCVRFY